MYCTFLGGSGITCIVLNDFYFCISSFFYIMFAFLSESRHSSAINEVIEMELPMEGQKNKAFNFVCVCVFQITVCYKEHTYMKIKKGASWRASLESWLSSSPKM